MGMGYGGRQEVKTRTQYISSCLTLQNHMIAAGGVVGTLPKINYEILIKRYLFQYYNCCSYLSYVATSIL